MDRALHRASVDRRTTSSATIGLGRSTGQRRILSQRDSSNEVQTLAISMFLDVMHDELGQALTVLGSEATRSVAKRAGIAPLRAELSLVERHISATTLFLEQIIVLIFIVGLRGLELAVLGVVGVVAGGRGNGEHFELTFGGFD